MKRMLALATIAVLALAGCSSSPPPVANRKVAELRVTGRGLSTLNASGDVLARVDFSDSEKKVTALLVSALGPATTIPTEAIHTSDWDGKVIERFASPRPLHSHLLVATESYRGVRIKAHGLSVGGRFPSAGAVASCALGDHVLYSAPVLKAGSDSSVVFASGEADTARIDSFQAPYSEQGC